MTDDQTKAKGDGWCARHPVDGWTDCFDYNENDCFNKWWRLYIPNQISREKAALIFINEGWSIAPVRLIAASEPTPSEAAAQERKRVIAEVRDAVESEPELPGRMPCAMWDAIKFDRDATGEALRIVVRETKKNLLAKLTELERTK